jgi:hypothetical protein
LFDALAAVVPDPQAPPIVLTQASTFQKSLADAAKTQNPRDALVNLSRSFIASKDFVASPSSTPFATHVVQFGKAIDELDEDSAADPKTLAALVKKEFGVDVGQVLKDPGYQSLISNLRDSIVAIKYVQVLHRSRVSWSNTDGLPEFASVQTS